MPNATLWRLPNIFCILLRHLLAGCVTDPIRVRLGHGGASRPVRFRLLFEDLGGSFLKFGQMLALQPDIIPLAYCNALVDLLDRVAPFPYSEVRRIFRQELGGPPESFFEDFCEDPLATASIGQVHLATLEGRKVAVKVQRPDIETQLGGDIRLMAAAIRVIKKLRFRPLYWMVEPLSEFVSWTEEELDYRNEARYMEQSGHNARQRASERVPKVSWKYTTRRVMTAEFIEGITVLEYLREWDAKGQDFASEVASRLGFDPHQFARNTIRNFLGDAFEHGMFHADLHPANLLILRGNVVGYIDFGITGALSRYSRRCLTALTLAYTQADLEQMLRLFLKISSYGAESDIDGFRKGLQRLSLQWYGQSAGRKELRTNITRVMLQMLILSRQTNIWPEKDVIKYIRSAIAIDGLITRFAPDFETGAFLGETCKEYLDRGDSWQAASYDTYFEWFAVADKLLLRTPRRIAQLVESKLDDWTEMPSSPPAHLNREAGRRRSDPSLSLAAVILTVVLLMLMNGEPPRLGVNLFSAQLLLLGTAVACLLVKRRRYASKEG